MPYFVAKISTKNQGTNAYLFDADDERDADGVAAALTRDFGQDSTLDVVMLLDEYMNGSILELCSF